MYVYQPLPNAGERESDAGADVPPVVVTTNDIHGGLDAPLPDPDDAAAVTSVDVAVRDGRTDIADPVAAAVPPKGERR